MTPLIDGTERTQTDLGDGVMSPIVDFSCDTVEAEFFTTSFDRPGEYALFCSLHPQMTGRVVVDD